MSDVTHILNAIGAGDRKAASQLLPLVYDELRKLAAVQMARIPVTRSTRRRSCMRRTYACWEPAAREREMLNPLLALRAPWNLNPLLALRAPWNRSPLLALRAPPRAPWNLPIGGIFSRRRPRRCGEFSWTGPRERDSLKRGGDRKRLRLDQLYLAADETPAEFLALHEALDKLAAIDQRKAELVKLRFFAGLTNQQAAETLGISTSTADNDWAYARAWLRAEIERP